MADLPNVGDLARLVQECCAHPSGLNMVGHVTDIGTFESACGSCGLVYEGVFGRVPDFGSRPGYEWFPLHWLRRIPPLSELESIDICDELDTERPSERVTA